MSTFKFYISASISILYFDFHKSFPKRSIKIEPPYRFVWPRYWPICLLINHTTVAAARTLAWRRHTARTNIPEFVNIDHRIA